MRYIALLRGINVGGNNKVSMAELKQVLEQAGMSNVSTYINSGNVIFESAESDTTSLAKILEATVEKRFNLKIHILVWGEKAFLALAAAIPASWTNDASMKCDVMFLWQKIDSPDIMSTIITKPDMDHLKYVPGALIWSVDRQNVTRSGMMKLVGTDTYKHMTIRNCNTVRKIAQLLRI